MNMINWIISIVLNSYTIIILYTIHNILKYAFNKTEYFKKLKPELTFILAFAILGTISHIYMFDVCNYEFKYLLDQFKQDTILFIFYHFLIGFICSALWLILIEALKEKQIQKNDLEIFKYEHDVNEILKYGYKDFLLNFFIPMFLNMNILNIFIYFLIKISIFWSKFLNINSFLNAISINQQDDYFETLMTALFSAPSGFHSSPVKVLYCCLRSCKTLTPASTFS